MVHFRVVYIVAYFVVLMFLNCHAQTITDIENLYTSVMTSYKKSIRPNTNHSEPTYINISVEMFKIVEVNLPLGSISIVATVFASWEDTRISWTPSSYGNATKLTLGTSEVWYPQFLFQPAVDDLEEFGVSSAKIQYTYTGSATMQNGNMLPFACDFNEAKYPFDVQNCYFIGLQVGYSSDDIKYNMDRSTLILRNYEQNSEWDLLSTDCFSIHYPPYVTFQCSFDMARKEKYFMLIKLVPILLLSYLNILCFKLPVESGERIGYAITCLLSLAFYLTDISNTLPTGSLNMSYLSYLLCVFIIFSSLSCAISILTSKVYNKDENTPVPKWLQKLSYWLSWPPLCFKSWQRKNKRKDSKIKPITVFTKRHLESLAKEETLTDFTNKDIEAFNADSTQTLDEELELEGAVETENIQINWKEVTYVVDEFTFYVVMIISTISLLATLLVIAT